MIQTLALLSISAYVAWRYSKTTTDPDWALFNLPAFTGSWYGKDFPDCKPPGIYLWFYAIAKVVGANEARIKFTHHFLLGAVSVALYLLTGNFWIGLAFAVLINSGWLYAFHGDVSAQPGALIAIAIAADNAWVGAVCLWLAVWFSVKIAPAAAVMVAVYGWWGPAIVIGTATLLVYVIFKKKEWMGWVIENTLTIPRKMSARRKVSYVYPWVPWFTAAGLMYLMPWILAGVTVNANPWYWLPAVVYALVLGWGNVIRPNHMLPFAAWIALAGIPPWWVLALAATDYVSAGLYLGDIWQRFYIGLRDKNEAAEKVGLWLRDKVGNVWVNDYHTGVYLAARKPVVYGMTEQYEVRDQAERQRAQLKERFKDDPPEYVVVGEASVNFNGTGYERAAQAGTYSIWRKRHGTLREESRNGSGHRRSIGRR